MDTPNAAQQLTFPLDPASVQVLVAALSPYFSASLVQQIVAGTAITISPSTGVGAVTITNAGVASLIAGAGISISGSTGNITISATTGGVTQIIAGTGISISPGGGTGAVTITATGGSGGITKATGTDTYSISGSHSFSTTHTITHGLGVTPKIITATTQLTPSGVPGSSVYSGNAVGTIMLDGSGTPIGGFSVSIQLGFGQTAMQYVSMQALANNITASTADTGGTATVTVTVNNVTSTTFDIVYSGSDNGGAGAPTQSFSVTWSVMA